MSFRTIAPAIALALLTGCTAAADLRDVIVPPERPPVAVPDVSSTPSEEPEVIQVNPSPVIVSPGPSPLMVRGLDNEPKPRASAETIAPDEALMSEMVCEPVTEATERKVYGLWGEEIGSIVQVEVGEGLEPGDIWWVVAYTTDQHPNRQALLTNFPGGGNGRRVLGPSVEGYGDYEWNPWDNVRWDAERLKVGQSALAKAFDCLEA